MVTIANYVIAKDERFHLGPAETVFSTEPFELANDTRLELPTIFMMRAIPFENAHDLIVRVRVNTSQTSHAGYKYNGAGDFSIHEVFPGNIFGRGPNNLNTIHFEREGGIGNMQISDVVLLVHRWIDT